MYPPVRQFDEYERTQHRQQTIRLGTAQRAWLAVLALAVVAAIVAGYVVAASS